jgi:hypothetical protein
LKHGDRREKAYSLFTLGIHSRLQRLDLGCACSQQLRHPVHARLHGRHDRRRGLATALIVLSATRLGGADAQSFQAPRFNDDNASSVDEFLIKLLREWKWLIRKTIRHLI